MGRPGREHHIRTRKPGKIRRPDEPKEPAAGTQTRYLTQEEDLLKLISTEPDFHPDLMIRGKEATLGKKDSGADIHLSSDAVSRMHARLKKEEAAGSSQT